MPKLDAYWMPFTANRQFKSAPRLVSGAEGMYFTTPEGRRVLDGVAGLWCVNAGHSRPRITQAIQAQAGHASIESTRIYLHLANDWLSGEYLRAAEAIEAQSVQP